MRSRGGSSSSSRRSRSGSGSGSGTSDRSRQAVGPIPQFGPDRAVYSQVKYS